MILSRSDVRAFLLDAAEQMKLAGSSVGDAKVVEGAEVLAEAAQAAQALEVASAPALVPLVDRLRCLEATHRTKSFLSVVDDLVWTSSPRCGCDGDSCALALLNRSFDFGAVTVGVLALRGDHTYPLHSHPPQETYVVLSGSAQWRFGGSTSFVPVPAGGVLYNNPDDLHSVIAGHDPVVAVYVLW